MNVAYTPSECVVIAVRQINRLMGYGADLGSAISIVAHKYGIDPFRLAYLYPDMPDGE